MNLILHQLQRPKGGAWMTAQVKMTVQVQVNMESMRLQGK